MSPKSEVKRKPVMPSTADRIKDIEIVLNGNGSSGLKSKVNVLEERVEVKFESIKDDINEIKNNQAWAMRLIVTQLLAFATAVILYLLNMPHPL